MKRATIHFDLLTPCISAGADQGLAEFRAPSIRGALHWWYRVLNPGDWQGERRIFGSAAGKQGHASALVTRVENRTGVSAQGGLFDILPGARMGDPESYLLWPLRKGVRGFFSPEGPAPAGFTLRCSHRRLREAKELPRETIETFALLGSIGTRSRRAFGSLWPTRMEVDDATVPPPDTLDGMRQRLAELLGKRPAAMTVLALSSGEASWREALKKCGEYLHVFRCGKHFAGVAPSEWGQSDHDLPFGGDDTTAYRAVLGLPLSQRYDKNKGGPKVDTQHGKEERWASPLLLKVVRLAGETKPYVPLAIFVDAMVLPEGDALELRVGGGRRGAASRPPKRVHLSHDLWRAMKEPDARYWSDAVRLFG